jgi:phosphoserine phosphatase RsbU/P
MTHSPSTGPSGVRLALLYHLAQTFNSTLDLDQVLNRVIDEVIVATHAERGFVMLREANGQLSFQIARGIDHQTINDPAFQVSRSVVDKVALEGLPILTFDAQTDSRFNMRQSVTLLGLRSVLCVPLIIKNTLLGVIYVDNRLQAGIFTQSDLDLLSAIASTAAIAIENARLYQIAVEKGRMERELQMARQVQVSFLPTVTPSLAGWEVAARWWPARQVSGDYYDFIPIARNHLGFVIADVSDKGMPAALFMALTRSIIRASMEPSVAPASGIERANRLLNSDSANGMFVTLFYVALNQTTGEFTYVNAGHNPALLCRCNPATNQVQITWLTKTGMALGIFPESLYQQNTLRLEHGDVLVLYTDGICDAQNPQGQPFGNERLFSVITSSGCAPAEQIVAALESSLAAFSQNSEPVDDITLLVIRRL